VVELRSIVKQFGGKQFGGVQLRSIVKQFGGNSIRWQWEKRINSRLATLYHFKGVHIVRVFGIEKRDMKKGRAWDTSQQPGREHAALRG
jgi:hypothetical protein